jgi:hypothetical protein
MKKNKMTIAILGCIGVFLIAALILVSAAQAGEKTVKFKIVAPITKMEFILVPDMKGHVIGVLERRGVAIYENGEIAAYHGMISFDAFKEQATWSGYSEISYADGSMTICKSQGTRSGSMPRLIKGTGEYIKGTGRFEGIKGKVSFEGKQNIPYTKDATKGDLVSDATVTYTLPKK